MQKIKKSQTKYIIRIINKGTDERIKNIDEYIQYVSRVQQTCNHFNDIIRNDQIIIDKDKEEIKHIKKLIKRRNIKSLSRMFIVREKDALQVAEEKIKEIEYSKEIIEYIKEKERKERLTKIVNQKYLIEQVNVDRTTRRINGNNENNNNNENEIPEKEKIMEF